MYTNHQCLVNTIRELCQQAQALLEEADILTRRDFILWQEIKTHISRITRAELSKRLHKPTQFHFKEMPIPPPQPQASSSQNLSARQHCIRYMRSGEPMRCYGCNSLSHIKWNCQLYVCQLCGQRQPGHAQKNCPDCYHDDRTQGYFDIKGGEIGNYNRECWNSDIIYVFILEPDGSIMKSLSSFFSFIPYLNMFPVAFTQTFEFIPPTSILEPAITPTFEQYYLPPILTKHPMWYSLDADFFILIWGILYGLHWQYLQNSPLFQEIVSHGEKQLVRLLPRHPIPFDILKNNLFDYFLILLYHDSFKLNHLARIGSI